VPSRAGQELKILMLRTGLPNVRGEDSSPAADVWPRRDSFRIAVTQERLE
jgi:hypothetical protein